MNSGGGGFGPGRGIGPGRGRGDRGDRGGHHGPGRGTGFAGFGGQQGPGNGFGGQQGFPSGRGGGYSSGRQFVAGESSGMADDRDHGQGQQFSTEFGTDFGQFNRGSNSGNFHRNGGNPQYRPRNYGNNFNSNFRYGHNGNRSNHNQYRNTGGGNNDTGNLNGANLAGINPELLKEAMQGVVAALAAAAQRGGAEGVAPSALGAVATAGAQLEVPAVQQPQTLPVGAQQSQPMQVDAMPKADIQNPAKKAKKIDNCFRCKKPGHKIDTCTAPVCDICESTNHISSACPLLQAPKPSVTMYGYAIEQLMFFELPTGGSYKPKVDNVKLVKVTVEGDPMSIPDIAECLRRIVPVENFQWEIYNFQNNVFRVKFPNKSEAQRMKTFRTYPVPDRASDLVFEDWSALEDPLYMLPEVWLRVRGIPADVRTDFLSLWAVGTLFGKTKEVDMVHTRKNKELRLRIGCLDHTLIPETTDVFIQRGFFKLSFEVEPVVVTQLDGNDMVNNGDNNGGGGNDGANEDKMDGAKDMDIERTGNNEQQGKASNQNITVKRTNNAKGVVGHQAQHHFEDSILFGSLNTEEAATSSLGIGAVQRARFCAATGQAGDKWRSATGWHVLAWRDVASVAERAGSPVPALPAAVGHAESCSSTGERGASWRAWVGGRPPLHPDRRDPAGTAAPAACAANSGGTRHGQGSAVARTAAFSCCWYWILCANASCGCCCCF
ncbi:hypothetical protein ACQ4PT_007850 [Festuca glaucescens]